MFMATQKYDCIIIGGGATGAGIARDLSLRGLRVILFEKNDLSEGTTGRCHAMNHSGGRYAYKDPEAARECALESQILFKIAPHISEECGGYFMGVDGEEVAFGDKFKVACKRSDVSCEEITPREFLAQEPKCNPKTQRVFRVRDGFIDPFLLTIYNAFDAKKHGASIRTYCEVKELIITDKTIQGVKIYDKITRTTEKIYGNLVINATGPWAAALEKQLDLSESLQITPTMGTLLVIKNRLVNSLINRLRPAGDGDIIVPSHQSILLGTTSKPVDITQLDQLMTDPSEIDYILSLGEHLIPDIRKNRVIRFYSGARPLISNKGSMREASRKFEIIDYESEGYRGLLTIFGGKVTTYRLMAEQLSDIACQKLGIKSPCSTASEVLPGGERPVQVKEFADGLQVDSKTAFDMSFKWGTFYPDIKEMCQSCLDSISPQNSPRTICECENVTEPELRWVHSKLGIRQLDDYRRRTRQGMGPCQGQFCYYKVANLEAQITDKSHSAILKELEAALIKRWKTQPAGDELLQRQIKLSKYMYLMGGNL